MSRHSDDLPKFAPASEAMRLVSRLGRQYAIVRNPSYVFPPFEAYPLAPKSRRLKKGLLGIVKDMDGTTTTTEALCLHSLELMVRRVTGLLTPESWAGLDHEVDYPHIIGNSTTRHVEYLIHTYRDKIRPEPFARSYMEAAAWTLAFGRDPGRRAEVENNIANLGLNGLREDRDFRALLEAKSLATEDARQRLDRLARRHTAAFRTQDTTAIVRAAIDVYYYRYHEILSQVSEGRGAALSREILQQEGAHLIEPMPGVAVFLCLVRGWLGADAERLFDVAAEPLRRKKGARPEALESCRGVLGALSRKFAERPVRVAVVTSSIEYEARIVLDEVFRVIREQIAQWPLAARRREALAARFASPQAYYDAMITASDSSEIRLKPHRDLYCIALHRLGIAPADFDQVAGFEDSESGTIAIRAAGVGCCVALPFKDTARHDFRAASVIAKGGLPQIMLKHRLFLDV